MELSLLKRLRRRRAKEPLKAIKAPESKGVVVPGPLGSNRYGYEEK